MHGGQGPWGSFKNLKEVTAVMDSDGVSTFYGRSPQLKAQAITTFVIYLTKATLQDTGSSQEDTGTR